MTTINGVINKVAPRTVISEGGKAFRTHNGIRQLNYDKWGMVWNGNHFAPPEVSSVLYLPGVPGAGSTIFDFSGSGNDGTVVGATWTQLPTGLWYLDLDGDDDYVSISNPTFINDTQGTVILWQKADTVASTLFATSVDGATDDEFFFHYASATQLRIILKVNGADIFVTTATADPIPNTTDFFMVSLTSDGSTIKAYFNTTLQTLSDTTGTNSGQWFNSAPDSDIFTFGVLKRATPIVDFDGGMALFRVFDVALTGAQIASIYNQERHLFGV